MTTMFGISPEATPGRPKAEPYTESEEMQAHTAWADVVSRVWCRFAHRSERTERVARRAFILGYVVGVRNGHTGPALTGRDVPISEAGNAVGALAEPELLGVGQYMEYHGTQVQLWGRYWVQGIAESSDPRTGETPVANCRPLPAGARIDWAREFTGASALFTPVSGGAAIPAPRAPPMTSPPPCANCPGTWTCPSAPES